MRNEKFLVDWQLVTRRNNINQIIAMMHAKHLCQMPQDRKADPSSMRQLINHVSSHMNALQALSLIVPVEDFKLNHLILETIDHETQPEWYLITATSTDTPTTALLITLYESRRRALKRIQITHSRKMFPATSRSSLTTGSKVTKPSYSNVATQVQCSLCNLSH